MTLSATNVVAGETATISIKNSSRTNQDVTVDITSPQGGPDSVVIHIDENGNGSSDWEVPEDWESVTFSDPGHCGDLQVVVSQGGGPGV